MLSLEYFLISNLLIAQIHSVVVLVDLLIWLLDIFKLKVYVRNLNILLFKSKTNVSQHNAHLKFLIMIMLITAMGLES